MRIAIGGISLEATNFSPIPTTLDDFVIQRGPSLLTGGRYPFLKELPAEFAPTLFARSWPGGTLRAGDYQTLKDEIVERLRAAGPVDGVYLDLHGAMLVEGLEDAEADLAAAVRGVVGPHTLIGASMDLHGNITPAYARQIDLLTAYRTAPHRDMLETRQRACRLLCQALTNGQRPHVFCLPIPILLSGESTRTDVEPGSRLWARLDEMSQQPGLLDVSLFVGFAWVDEARAHAAAVVSGTDADAMSQAASQIAQAYWEARHNFRFGTPVGSIDQCIEWALAAPEPTVFLSDSGDNTTAGAVGDIPLFLEHLLVQRVPSAVVAGLVDAQAVTACQQAGVCAEVETTIGGRLDTLHGRPLPVHGRVLTLFNGDAEKGLQAVLQVENVQVILTERRCAFIQESDFIQVGVNPLSHKIVVVKLGYLFPDLLRIAPKAYMALSPGAADQELTRLPYRRIARPMFPLDREFEWQSGG
jgi:microcystin degradation protein MlrC